MPISSTFRFAVKCNSCVRDKRFRTTTSPRWFIPTRWNVVFAKSIPSVNSSMALLLRTLLIIPPFLPGKSGGPCH